MKIVLRFPGASERYRREYVLDDIAYDPASSVLDSYLQKLELWGVDHGGTEKTRKKFVPTVGYFDTKKNPNSVRFVIEMEEKDE